MCKNSFFSQFSVLPAKVAKTIIAALVIVIVFVQGCSRDDEFDNTSDGIILSKIILLLPQ